MSLGKLGVSGLVAVLVGLHPARANDGLKEFDDTLASHTHRAEAVEDAEPPLVIDVTYSADIWRAARGGVRSGSHYLDNFEFDVLEPSGLFMGSAHGIGTDISQSGADGLSIFPSISLGVRVALSPAAGWTLRTAIKLGNDDGALLIGEVEAPLENGKLLFGHWRNTAPADAVTGAGQHRNHGYCLRGEARQMPESVDPKQGLTGSFRLGTADGRTNQFGRFASVGFTYAGLTKGCEEDQFALAAAYSGQDQR